MSKLVALLVTVVVAAIAAPVAIGTDDPLQSSLDDLVAWDPAFAEFQAPPPGAQQMVVGSLKFRLQAFDLGYEHLRISAHSGAAGVDPHGQLRFTSTVPGLEVDQSADVVCLRVIGRVSPFIGPTAFVWARLHEPYQGNEFIELQIRDNGNPGDFPGFTSPDDAFRGYSPGPPPPDCEAGGFEFGVEKSGNLIVREPASG